MTGAVSESPALPSYTDFRTAGGLLFLSGRVALDPDTGGLIQGDVTVQTEQVLRNIGAVLKQAGRSLSDVVKCTVYLTSMTDFERMNSAYREGLPTPLPARTTVAVSGLPYGAAVEIEVVATSS